jgi:fatty-acyl-CoA synthase
MTGYHQNVDATHKCLDDHGWLDTGDMGYVANGNLYITGRKKDMIIINGRNIWPQDLEWYAEQGVAGLRTRDTAAFALAAPDGREEVVILVHCRTNDLTLHGLLKKQVRSVIFTRCGVDCRVETIPNRSLPFTTSGKLQRGKAKELWLAGDYKFEPKIADKSLVS